MSPTRFCYHIMLYAMLLLVTAGFYRPGDPERVRSLSGRLKCNCGCREVLGECSHQQCARKPAMSQEISAAVTGGNSDDEILAHMAKVYGSDVLLSPMFRGFDTLLWIVPIAGAVVAVGLTLAGRRRGKNISS